MKTNRLFILAAASLAALAACNRESIIPDNGPRTITIQATVGSMTKVTTTGNATAFDSGDKLALYAWTGDKTAIPAIRVVDGVENTYDGTNWTPVSQMLWADMTSDHYFLGVYPAHAITDFAADPYTLDPAEYEASDLLIATSLIGLKASDNPVTLNFDHAVSKIFVNLTFRNQWAATPAVSAVSITARKTGTVDYLTKTITASATESAAPVPLTRIENAAWSGLQLPQDGVNTITITIEGKDYVFTHSSDIPLVGGQYTTVNLIVGRDTVELASVGVSNWAAGTTIEGGEAQTDD